MAMSTSHEFWQGLFAESSSQAKAQQVELRLVRKRGRPLLLLPGQKSAAVTALSLYPAQSRKAQAAKTVLRWSLKSGLPFAGEKVSLPISPDDAFARVLASVAGVGEGRVPLFAILAGNPASEGQRFLVLVFDERQRAVAVVKIGLSEAAQDLISREATFLNVVSGKARGLPKLLGRFDTPQWRALALDFYDGNSPRPVLDRAGLELLSSWADPSQKLPLSETATWARLQKAAGTNEVWEEISASLQQRAIARTLQHGDFAPWNIKVSPAGTWTVLDWERGEEAGVPGWDWFHYVIQPAILVERLATANLVSQVDGLLLSEPFRGYAAKAGIAGCESELVLAYLLYVTEVIKPSEGLGEARDLRTALAARSR
jgi:hypothetical protein